MKRVTIGLAMALVAAGVAAPGSAASAAPVNQVCSAVFVSPLNLNAAANVMVPNGKKKPRKAGMASARAMAAVVLVDTNGNPCNEPLGENAAENISAVLDDALAQGETQIAHDGLMQYATEIVWTPQFPRAGVRKDLRAGSTCANLESHGLKLPEQVRTEIGIAQRAQALGWDDVATAAMDNAVKITTDWANSAADDAATSIPDWMGIEAKLQLIGADQAAIDKARSNAVKIAKDSYSQYNKHACRTTKNDISCFLRAAQLIAALGAEPASFQQDVAYQVTNARNLAKGKEKLCPVEKYLFRIRFQSDGPEGQKSDVDTGLITLVVKDHKITSPDAKALRIVSSGEAHCWAKDENDQWQIIGTGNVTGGSFPLKVTGVDDGTTLHVQLKQNAHVSMAISGSDVCQLAQLAVDLFNDTMRSFATPGFELPAGEISEETVEVTHAIFEPTGETTTDTTTTIFKQIYPKRDVPEDPYS